MKRLIHICILLALFVPEASATIIKGTVLAAGRPVPAEYTLLPDGTVGLGSGHNACISQYTKGRITVPSKIIVSDKTYNVSRIMPLAFRLCTNTKVIIIREGPTSIGDFAFVGCSSLIEVELPSTIQSVGSGLFSGLKNLQAIICKALTPPQWDYYDVCFNQKSGNGQVQQFDESVGLYVPIGTDEAYQQAKYTNPSLGWTTPEGWGTAFAKIHPNAMEGFRIYSQEDLDELNYVVNSSSMYEAIKHVYLETDIDMNGYEWTAPIGNTPEHAFKGTFHGQGHYIRNLKVNSQDIAGLFGYFNGEKITGVRLENCDFRGKELAGGLVAECGACTIDSSYVYAATRSDVLAGGIVGRSTGFVNIDRCVAGGLAFPYTISGGANPLLAGIIGSTTGTLVTNCAMMKSFADYARYSIFVGECTSDFVSMVNYSYSGQHETAPIDSEATGICYGEHILQYGQPLSIIDYAGNRQDMTYNESTLRSVYPASVLGFEGWAYNNGEFPLPDCFTDRWPTKPNHAVYGSPALAAESINVLTPDEFIPPSAWLDLSDIGFRHYSFRASRLWIDGNMDVFDRAEQLPLGLSEQITVEQGILLEDTLYAEFTGTEPVYKPVYLLNDKNELVYDEAGNMICIDSLFIFNKNTWRDKVYSLCLPYNVALSGNCTLYQPTQIYDVDGETTAFFSTVRDNYVEAFRPYLVVVHNERVTLGTRTAVVCPAIDSKTLLLGDYEFEGTTTRKGNITARENNIYMLKDSTHWLRFKDSDDISTDVAPFTAYFQSVRGNPAKRINIVLDQHNPIISVGDFYYAINNEDAEHVTATLLGYHGRGGNVVVPATAPYVLYGQKQEVPLTDLSPNLFTRNTAEIWSIDMSQCTSLKPFSIDRSAKGNPFYSLDARTIIYVPQGKAGAGRNVVVGTECQSLDLTDGWDFKPPYDFHAAHASYDRKLYASKQQNGTFKSMTYTICLPFDVDMSEYDTRGVAKVLTPYYYKDEKELLFSYGLTQFQAGKARVIKVLKDYVEFSATDVTVKAEAEEMSPVLLWGNVQNESGTWQGTFARIDNEEAALMKAHTLYSNGKWYRIRSDEGRYRDAWVGAFRGYYTPIEQPSVGSLSAVFKLWVQGDDDDPITRFPSDLFVSDSNFSNYDTEGTGIELPSLAPAAEEEAWFTLDGRKLDSKPQTKGLYIYKGKKIVIK